LFQDLHRALLKVENILDINKYKNLKERFHMNKSVELKHDVVVIGGGPGGLSAAISAAREGADVLLVERNSMLGGAAASGLGVLGYLDSKGRKSLGGLAQEYIDRLAEYQAAIGHYRCPVHNSISPISPDMFGIIAVEMCREAGVKLLFNCELIDVMVDNGRVVKVAVYGKCTRIEIEAKIFIDGTGDGDLAYMSGAEYISGQDGTGIMQPSTLMFTITDYDLEKLFDYIKENPEEAGIKEKYAENYNLDFFRSTRGHCFIGLNKLIEKARESGEFDIPRNQFIYIKTPYEAQLAINTVRIISIDGSDIFQVSKGLEEGYRQILQLLKFMRKYIPGFENCRISRISPSLGVRESRHFIGKKRLTKEEMYAYKNSDDTIALCAYNVDIHSGTADHIDLHRLEKPFGIPYGCLVPKSIDGLLLSGRIISVDSTVFGAARVMGPLMAAGEAAGISAAICIKKNLSPSDVPVAEIREIILKNGGILEVK
jgi:hypothetical protein